jgi:anti-anti-sigma factor
MENLRVTSNDGEVIVYGPGRITLGRGAATLREVVRSLNTAGFSKITLDMSTTSYVDSAGIAEMVVAFTSMANSGGALKLNRPTKRIQDLLQITKLYTVFDVYDNNFDHLPHIEINGGDVSAIKAAQALPVLLSLRNDRIRVELGVQDEVYRVQTDDLSRGSNLIIARPHVLAASSRTQLRADVDGFEDLINSQRTRESDIHHFFEEHPTFLLGQEYRQLHSKVLLERNDDGPLIPDFMLQPFDDELCDLLELKLPREPVVVGRENRKRFSSAVQEAVAQLRTYRDYFDDRTRREEIQRRYGIRVYRPRMAVLIGRVTSVDPIEYRRIADGQKEVRIMTYDDLLKRARRFLIV